MSTSDDWIAHLTQERRPANTVAAARRVLRSLPSADTQREGGGKVSLYPCGCWVTESQAAPITARGDDT